MLTPTQAKCLKYIDYFMKSSGAAPSYEDIRRHMGLASKSGVGRLIDALVDRRFLARDPRRARSLQVLRLPGPPEEPKDRFTVLLMDREQVVHEPRRLKLAAYWVLVNANSISAARIKAWHHMAIEKDISHEDAEHQFEIIFVMDGWHMESQTDVFAAARQAHHHPPMSAETREPA